MSEIRVDTISEKTSANGVAVDGVTLKDGAVTSTAASTITVADNSDNLTLTSTDADANSGPNLRLYRNSSSPADSDVLGQIDFEGRNDNSQDFVATQIKVNVGDVSDGTEDAQIEFDVMTGGTLREYLRMASGSNPAVIVNQDSRDINFQVLSDGNDNMLFVDGGEDHVGIGTNVPKETLHIEDAAPILRISDSNSTSEDDAVGKIQFYDRNNTDLNAEIIAGTGSLADLILSAHNNRAVVLQTNGNTERMRVTGDGKLATGAETAPDCDAGGITLDQNANDGNIITLKSSDVAHGITGSAETDTYLSMGKASGTAGGFMLKSYAEGDDGFLAESFCGTVNTTKGTGGNACFMFKGRAKDSGSSFQNPTSTAANANLLAIANGNIRVFIFDGEGDLHADGSLNANAYDTYEDAHLVRAMDLSHGQNLKGLVNSKFDEYINYNHETLAEAGLVGREEDGTPNHFVNVTGMQRLHNGAIWQQYEKTERLTQAMYELAKAAVGEEKANEILEQNEIKLLN